MEVKMSSDWEIVFINCRAVRELDVSVLTSFEVTPPKGKVENIIISFGRTFIDDYFSAPNVINIEDQNRRYEFVARIVSKKKGLFKTWGLVKTEECLNEDPLVTEPMIVKEDIDWAKSIDKGYLKPSSQIQSDNTYIFTTEKKD
jgi:hypothetical protein